MTSEPTSPRAIYAALNSRPVTDEAQALVDAVVGQVNAYERTLGKNKRHGDRAEAFTRLTGAFLADLLRALAHRKADGWVFRAMMPGTFTGEGDASYRKFKSLKDALVGAGLASMRLGTVYGASSFPMVGEDGEDEDYDDADIDGESSATRFKATPELQALFAAHGIVPEDARVHFLQELPPKPIVLRGASKTYKGIKTRGAKLDVMKEASMEHLREDYAVHEADMLKLNTFLDGFTLVGGVHRGFRRVFNEADLKSFAFNKGGRLYSQGEDAYQTMNSTKRGEMTINGKAVAELDIRASYLTVLHGLRGLPFDARTDPYEVDTLTPMKVGKKDMRRWAVKSWCVATLGHFRHHRQWPKKLKEAFMEDTGNKLQEVYPIAHVKEAMTTKFPVLGEWDDLDVTWADLMAKEAAAMFDTMMELMTAHRMPSYTVHDSLCVRQDHVPLAKATLERHYLTHCGLLPYIPIGDDER